MSGREANVFYLNRGGGKFADVSGVSGLDFTGDGRAFSVLDLDQDGDLDMILKSRTGPQIRVLRNNNDNGNHSVAFRLIGTQSNRDAVGTVIRLKSSAGSRVKQVSIGSGFLSQSTSWVYFGLGTAESVDEVTIQWPNGGTSVFRDLPVDQRITILEGEQDFRAEAFVPPNQQEEACNGTEGIPPAAPRYEGIAMGQPVVFPPYEGETLAGKTVPLHRKGKITILNLWATWCVPCQTEMKLWKDHYRDIRAAGADLMAVSVDDPGDRQKVKDFAGSRALPFAITHMTPETLERFVTFFKLLFTRSGDPPIPTTLLLNRKGEVAKVYLGLVPMEILLGDIRDIQQGGTKLKQAFLPYSGRSIDAEFSRDYHTLAVNFMERNMLSEAVLYLGEALKTERTNARLWNKLGLVQADRDNLAQSREALERAVKLDPDFADGHFDLGVTYLRLNRPEEAEASFSRATQLDSVDPRKHMMRQLTMAQNGKPGDPIQILESYLKEVPSDAEAQFNLGALYSQKGYSALALAQFIKAHDLNPYFAPAAKNLGIEYLKQQRPLEAQPVLQQYLSLQPNDADAHFALAIVYGQTGRQKEAIQQLERVVELQPGHPQATQMLQQIRSQR